MSCTENCIIHIAGNGRHTKKSCVKTNENQTVCLFSGDELNTCGQFSLEYMYFVKCFLFFLYSVPRWLRCILL